MAAQLPAGGLGKLAGEGGMGPPPAAGASGPVGHPGSRVSRRHTCRCSVHTHSRVGSAPSEGVPAGLRVLQA